MDICTYMLLRWWCWPVAFFSILELRLVFFKTGKDHRLKLQDKTLGNFFDGRGGKQRVLPRCSLKTGNRQELGGICVLSNLI